MNLDEQWSRLTGLPWHLLQATSWAKGSTSKRSILDQGNWDWGIWRCKQKGQAHLLSIRWFDGYFSSIPWKPWASYDSGLKVMNSDHIIYHPNEDTFKNERGYSYNYIGTTDIHEKVPGKLRHVVTQVMKLNYVPCLRRSHSYCWLSWDLSWVQLVSPLRREHFLGILRIPCVLGWTVFPSNSYDEALVPSTCDFNHVWRYGLKGVIKLKWSL